MKPVIRASAFLLVNLLTSQTPLSKIPSSKLLLIQTDVDKYKIRKADKRNGFYTLNACCLSVGYELSAKHRKE